MSWNLPKLPGYTFQNPTKMRFNVPRKLDYVNGFMVVRNDTRGVGGIPMDVHNTAYLQPNDDFNFDPALIYGSVNRPIIPTFRPRFVEYDKKLLIFKAHFDQYSIQPRVVNIIYYLEDDTLTITEPNVKNSGLWQGKIVKRGHILKDDEHDYWHWKDLNVGADVSIQGLTFHIVSCDDYTEHFLRSQGIEVPAIKAETPIDYDESNRCTNRSLHHLDKILQFNAIWENSDNADMLDYKISYHLNDDTISVKECHEAKNREIFRTLLRRTKLPKNWQSQNFDSQIMSDTDINYYGVEDLIVGNTIDVLGRKFRLYDCNQITRDFYKNALYMEQPPRIEPPFEKQPERRPIEIPPHTGIGDPDDTLMSCLSFHKKPPFKDLVQYNLNTNKSLRYLCELISVHPEDMGRQFVLSYRLSDATICVDELTKNNSGLMGGRFSGPSRVVIPGRSQYYTPDMFNIGSIITINCHKFRITGCDLFVYEYMKENPEKFPSDVIQNILEYHVRRGNVRRETAVKEVSPRPTEERSEIQHWEPNAMPESIQGIDAAQTLPEKEDKVKTVQDIVCTTGLSDLPEKFEHKPPKPNYDCNCGGRDNSKIDIKPIKKVSFLEE